MRSVEVNSYLSIFTLLLRERGGSRIPRPITACPTIQF